MADKVANYILIGLFGIVFAASIGFMFYQYMILGNYEIFVEENSEEITETSL